jgi:cell division protein ZapE
MTDEQSLLNTYNKMVLNNEIEKNKSQETLLFDLEALKKKLEKSRKLKKNATRRIFSKFFQSKSPEQNKGIYIYGGVGIGKSMLMDLFFNLLDIKEKKRIHFHEFMKRLHQLIQNARENNIIDPIKSVASEYTKNIEVLCLDEMQITDVADAMIVGRVFEEFLRKKLIVITTSNRHPRDLYKNGLNRKLFLPFIDIMVSRLNVVKLSADVDYRKIKIAGEKKYFLSNSAQDTIQFNDLVSQFNLNRGSGIKIQMHSREFEIKRFENGVGLLTFNDFCSVPLSSSDYLQIVSHLRLLFLDEIPNLSNGGDDSAKRFINLIDSVYDKKVGLLCRAEAYPENLYIDGKNSFEFQRTVSRLFEMQSYNWPEREKTC